MSARTRFLPVSAVLFAVTLFCALAVTSHAGIKPPMLDPCGLDDGDQVIVGQGYANLGDIAEIPVYVGSDVAISTFRFVLVLPDEAEFDGVDPGTWTHPVYDSWDPVTRKLTLDNVSNTELMTPNINDVFFTIRLTTHCQPDHAVTGNITWATYPESFTGYPDCTHDPIEFKQPGSVTIAQVYIRFDIAEEAGFIGDEVSVAVTCLNGVEFKEFNDTISYDPNVLVPLSPATSATARTDGCLNESINTTEHRIAVYGTRPDGYGTSSQDGADFYYLNFRVISPYDDVTGLLSFVGQTKVIALDCDQELHNLTPQAVYRFGGQVDVPPYVAEFDLGDAVWNTEDDCDSVAVPIMLKNNYPIGNFLLMVRYSTNLSDPIISRSVQSADAGWPMTNLDRVCNNDSYAYILKENGNPIPVAADFVTIGWLWFKNTATGADPATYSLVPYTKTCVPTEDCYVIWHDPVGDTDAVFSLDEPQLDGQSGSLDIQDPALQVSVPGAQSDFCKWPPDCEWWATTPMRVLTNASAEEASFRINFDNTKFCLRFDTLASNVTASVHHSYGYADVTITDIPPSQNWQWFGTVRFTNGTYDDQTGSHTVTLVAGTSACNQSAMTGTGAGGSVFTYGMQAQYGSCFPSGGITKAAAVPLEFKLLQNHPNPFNAGTLINFTLAEGAHTRLEIYNIMGQRVRTLMNDFTVEGEYSIRWDGRDDNGASVASGVYLYRLQSGIRTDTKKMLLLK